MSGVLYLLGVADAVGDIGKPPESDDISRRLLELIRQPSLSATSPETPQIAHTPKRRRLGRSLNDIQGLAEESE